MYRISLSAHVWFNVLAVLHSGFGTVQHFVQIFLYGYFIPRMFGYIHIFCIDIFIKGCRLVYNLYERMCVLVYAYLYVYVFVKKKVNKL